MHDSWNARKIERTRGTWFLHENARVGEKIICILRRNFAIQNQPYTYHFPEEEEKTFGSGVLHHWLSNKTTITLPQHSTNNIMYSKLISQQQQHQQRQHQVMMATSPPTAKLPKSAIFATAGIGGCMGWCVVHPFNTIAVRSNLASAAGQTFTLGGMIEKQGLMSVYDGLSAGILRQVFYATSRFGLFETFRDILHEYRGKTDFASR